MLQVYRERVEIDIVAERKNLSVGRLRLYVQMALPNWKETSAASFVWNDPTVFESGSAISEHKLSGVVGAMGVDVQTLLHNASV